MWKLQEVNASSIYQHRNNVYFIDYSANYNAKSKADCKMYAIFYSSRFWTRPRHKIYMQMDSANLNQVGNMQRKKLLGDVRLDPTSLILLISQHHEKKIRVQQNLAPSPRRRSFGTHWTTTDLCNDRESTVDLPKFL